MPSPVSGRTSEVPLYNRIFLYYIISASSLSVAVGTGGGGVLHSKKVDCVFISLMNEQSSSLAARADRVRFPVSIIALVLQMFFNSL